MDQLCEGCSPQYRLPGNASDMLGQYCPYLSLLSILPIWYARTLSYCPYCLSYCLSYCPYLGKLQPIPRYLLADFSLGGCWRWDDLNLCRSKEEGVAETTTWSMCAPRPQYKLPFDLLFSPISSRKLFPSLFGLLQKLPQPKNSQTLKTDPPIDGILYRFKWRVVWPGRGIKHKTASSSKTKNLFRQCFFSCHKNLCILHQEGSSDIITCSDIVRIWMYSLEKI